MTQRIKTVSWALVMGWSCTFAQAQDAVPPPNLDLTLRAEGGAVAQVLAAQDLFALAKAQSDPLAALAAARIMAGVAVGPVTRVPVGGTAIEGAAIADAPAMFTVARRLALDDNLAALVEAERGRSKLGVGTLIIGASSALVAAGATDRWDMAFYAGSLAEIGVIGPDNVVLDIQVQDAAGHIICRQSGPRDRLYCPFVPQENGRFSVLIANPGGQTVTYSLLTN